MNTSQHPTSDQLRDFGLGRLSAEAQSQIEAHVAECETCCRGLARLGDDTLVEMARAAADTDLTGLPATRELPHRHLGDGAPAAPALPDEHVDPALRDHPKYRILGVLGRGGMGVVYKAQHRFMDRLLALKVVRRSLTSHPTAIERFKLEGRAAARLSHPNIVTAYDCEELGDCYFLAMEYVPGISLDRLVASQGRLSVARACSLMAQVARGLEHAHQQGMIHRDIKPQNLLVTRDGAVKILDFGLARFASERRAAEPGELTSDGSFLGTPDYIAPEQIDDPRQADIRADLYSLGCTLYFLLAGHAPFPKGSAMQKLKAHANTTPTPLSQLRADVPAELEAILKGLLAKSPEQRYQSPSHVAAALEALAGQPEGAAGGWGAGPGPSEAAGHRSDAVESAEPTLGQRSAGVGAAAPTFSMPSGPLPGAGSEGSAEPPSPSAAAGAASPLESLSPVELPDPLASLPPAGLPAPAPRRRRLPSRRAKPWSPSAAIATGAGAVLLALIVWGAVGGGCDGGRGGGSDHGGTAAGNKDAISGGLGGDQSPPATTPGAVRPAPPQSVPPAAPLSSVDPVLFYVPTDFWDADYTDVRGELDRAGVPVIVCGDAPEAVSETGQSRVDIEASLSQAIGNVERYSLLVLAGKRNIEQSQRPDVWRLIQEFRQRGKPIGAICKAQQLLEGAGVLDGMRIARISEYNRGRLKAAKSATAASVEQDDWLITATEGETAIAAEFGRKLVTVLRNLGQT